MISSMDKNLAGISSRHNLVHGQYSWQIFLYCILFPKVMQCPHEFISWISRFCGGTVGGACCKVALVVTWCRHKHARVYLHQLESFCGRILLLFGLFRKLEGFVAVTGQQEKKKKKEEASGAATGLGTALARAPPPPLCIFTSSSLAAPRVAAATATASTAPYSWARVAKRKRSEERFVSLWKLPFPHRPPHPPHIDLKCQSPNFDFTPK